VATVYRFALEGVNLIDSSEWVCGMHYQTDVAALEDEPGPSTVLDAILDHFSSSGHNLTDWTNVMTTSSKITRAYVRSEPAPGGQEVPVTAQEALNLPGTFGALSGNALPSEMCVWIAFGSAAATRSGRGGTHTPGPYGTGQIDATSKWNFTGTFGSNLNTLAGKIHDQIGNVFEGTGDLNPVVYSRTRRARGFTPYTFRIETAIVSPDPRWLRRRHD